jgi:aminoglycoside 3-N-acetyltransferase
MMHSRESLARDAVAMSVRAGDLLMVHASIRAVGAIAGGPDQIHLALGDAVGDTGSLFMYASCPDHYDQVGTGTLPADVEAHLIESLPPFDARTARAQPDNGALVELLRTWPGTATNDHVVRFVCRGPHAARLFETQPWDYAYGHGSPLARFVSLGGRILLLGSDHDAVTFLHYAEHVLDVPGKIVLRYQVPLLEAGRRRWRWVEEFDTGERAHPHWPDRFFARLVDRFLERSGNAGGRIGDAAAHLLDASALLEFALEVMQQVAIDPAAADRCLPAP